MPDAVITQIKEQVTSRILRVRSGVDDSLQAKLALKKKTKFLGFIINLHIKTGFRRWKEQVFGMGGDPRLALLLTSLRQQVRSQYFEPQLKRMKVIAQIKDDF